MRGARTDGKASSCQTCELRYADVPEGVYVNYYQLTAPVWPSEAHSCRSKDSFVSKKGRITGAIACDAMTCCCPHAHGNIFSFPFAAAMVMSAPAWPHALPSCLQGFLMRVRRCMCCRTRQSGVLDVALTRQVACLQDPPTGCSRWAAPCAASTSGINTGCATVRAGCHWPRFQAVSRRCRPKHHALTSCVCV
jgi:hypothetical protein